MDRVVNEWNKLSIYKVVANTWKFWMEVTDLWKGVELFFIYWLIIFQELSCVGHLASCSKLLDIFGQVHEVCGGITIRKTFFNDEKKFCGKSDDSFGSLSEGNIKSVIKWRWWHCWQTLNVCWTEGTIENHSLQKYGHKKYIYFFNSHVWQKPRC